MQEEVEHRTVTLAISTTKMSAQVLKSAISKYLAHCKEKKSIKENPLRHRCAMPPLPKGEVLCIFRQK